MKTFLALVLVFLSILGVFDAGYITYTRISGTIPECRPPFACDTVLKSAWSSVGPIPLSVLGLCFYISIFMLSILAVLELPKISIGKHSIAVPSLILLLGMFGAVFSLYLVFVMGVVLQAWCLYCLLSAANCMMIGIVSTILFRISRYEVHI